MTTPISENGVHSVSKILLSRALDDGNAQGEVRVAVMFLLLTATSFHSTSSNNAFTLSTNNICCLNVYSLTQGFILCTEVSTGAGKMENNPNIPAGGERQYINTKVQYIACQVHTCTKETGK